MVQEIVYVFMRRANSLNRILFYCRLHIKLAFLKGNAFFLKRNAFFLNRKDFFLDLLLQQKRLSFDVAVRERRKLQVKCTRIGLAVKRIGYIAI